MKPVYRLYIDESGIILTGRKKRSTHNTTRREGNCKFNLDSYPHLEKDDKRYLGLTGCIFKLIIIETASDLQ